VTAAGQQDEAALGFGTDPTRTPESSVTDNDYTQVSRPGVHLLPRAVSGDLVPGLGWTATFVAASQVPRTQMRCSNPAWLVTPPGCSLPEDTMGAFHWSFGDGTSLTTPVQARVRASFSPFVHHVYTRPGRYTVTVSTADADGSPATTRLQVVVHPALTVRVARSGGDLVARARGGDGGVLDVVWRRRDGAVSHAVSVPSGWARTGTTVTVYDGTGTAATAAA
jgi:hypothetical protein